MISAGYDYEGVAFYSTVNTADTPVYRLFAPAIDQHLYTTDPNEKNTLVATGGWNYEGIAMYEYGTNQPNSEQIFRLYAPSLGTHLLTISAYEQQQLLATGGWNNEGVAFYAPTN
jgi:hypothetical protein